MKEEKEMIAIVTPRVYDAPRLEVIEVGVEKGFALSPDDWDDDDNVIPIG